MGPIFVLAGDGTRIAGWDFTAGAEEPRGRPPVLMVHGTGLNGRSWAPVAEVLAGAGLWPLAIDMRGHGSSDRSRDEGYPWYLFGADVLAAVDGLGLAGGAGPGLIGVGHSAGGTALLMAEAARPGTFSRLWVWEPIMSTANDTFREVRGAELAERARRRRADFGSVEEARGHYEGRGMFREFSRAALDGFMSDAFVPVEGGGVTLACRPEDEARIYEGGALHDAWDRLVGARCPVRVVGGALSPAVPPEDVERIARQLPAGEAFIVPGLAHFGPFQDPTGVAADIVRWAGAPIAVPGPGSA